MSPDTLLYLSASDVASALDHVDVVAAVTDALVAHGRGETILPTEAYLGWEHEGETLRSLSMPGLTGRQPGVKIINANPANPRRGLPRASGLFLLLDPADGRPTCILEAAQISCLRTAAVTAISAHLLGPDPIEQIALIGAGALARCHLMLLPGRLPQLREVRLHDLDHRRATALAEETPDRRVKVCDTAEEAIRAAQLVVPLTTTSSGYIAHDWLKPGTLLVNISLDDPRPEVILRADKLFVDDCNLVTQDERRLLGHMLRAGQIRHRDDADNDRRAIDGELGELLTGKCEGRTRKDQIIVVNPFGLAIEDLAVAEQVHRHALENGLGTWLKR